MPGCCQCQLGPESGCVWHGRRFACLRLPQKFSNMLLRCLAAPALRCGPVFCCCCISAVCIYATACVPRGQGGPIRRSAELVELQASCDWLSFPVPAVCRTSSPACLLEVARQVPKVVALQQPATARPPCLPARDIPITIIACSTNSRGPWEDQHTVQSRCGCQ